VYDAFAPGMYHDLVLRKPELVVQAVQIVLGRSATKNVKGTRQMVRLPAYEVIRSTSDNIRKSDERVVRLASVLLEI
jgi:hypothetical protein